MFCVHFAGEVRIAVDSRPLDRERVRAKPSDLETKIAPIVKDHHVSAGRVRC